MERRPRACDGRDSSRGGWSIKMDLNATHNHLLVFHENPLTVSDLFQLDRLLFLHRKAIKARRRSSHIEADRYLYEAFEAANEKG